MQHDEGRFADGMRAYAEQQAAAHHETHEPADVAPVTQREGSRPPAATPKRGPHPAKPKKKDARRERAAARGLKGAS